MGTHPIFESDFDCLTEYSTLPFAFPMAEDRVMAEEKCLRQQTRILEQMRQMQKVDVDLFHFETVCQNQTDDEFNQRDEILRLEDLVRLTERIIDLHNMITKADKTIELMTDEINQHRAERNRSYSEPANQSTPLKVHRQPRESEANREANRAEPTFARTASIKRFTSSRFDTSRFDSMYRSKRETSKARSQSYRETRSEISIPMLKTTPNLFFRSSERRLPIPVECPRVPELPTLPKKKSFHPRLVIERKKELDLSIRRSASDVAISEKILSTNAKMALSTSKSDRKLNSCDTDSDTGVSSMHSSETEFRFSPERNDRKITLV